MFEDIICVFNDAMKQHGLFFLTNNHLSIIPSRNHPRKLQMNCALYVLFKTCLVFTQNCPFHGVSSSSYNDETNTIFAFTATQ